MPIESGGYEWYDSFVTNAARWAAACAVRRPRGAWRFLSAVLVACVIAALLPASAPAVITTNWTGVVTMEGRSSFPDGSVSEHLVITLEFVNGVGTGRVEMREERHDLPLGVPATGCLADEVTTFDNTFPASLSVEFSGDGAWIATPKLGDGIVFLSGETLRTERGPGNGGEPCREPITSEAHFVMAAGPFGSPGAQFGNVLDPAFVSPAFPGDATLTGSIGATTVGPLSFNDFCASGPYGCATYTWQLFRHADTDGTLIIEKQTLPDGASDSFTFTGALPGSLTDGQTMLKSVTPGTYTVTEAATPGWTLTDVSCDDSDSTWTGATATFRVDAGETVRCVFTNEPTGLLTVTGAYSYFGTLGSGQATAVGTDSVLVTGSAVALSRVSNVCVVETWTATDDLLVPTSLPQMWNGQVGPFADPRLTLVKRDRPGKGGLFTKLYEETVRYADCRSGTEAAFPAFPDGALSITHTGAFVKLQHKLTVQAHLTDGRVLSVDVAGSTAKPPSFSWAKSNTQVFAL